MDLSHAQKIHDGKFSVVYLVEKGGQKFIVKQLHPRLTDSPKDVERFMHESSIPDMGGITAKILDVITRERQHYIVKEYLPGLTVKELNTKFRRKKYFPGFALLYIAICHKINQLHQHGFLHGDIKPSNILFNGDFAKGVGEIRMLDMGLALKIDQLPVKRSTPLHFSMLYAAPELMLNEPGLLGKHSDLFGLGICMYESMLGKLPYQDNHPAVLLQMMLAVPLPPSKRIPAKWMKLIQRITLKPDFRRPVAQYSVEEVRSIMRKNIEIRQEIPDASVLADSIQQILPEIRSASEKWF